MAGTELTFEYDEFGPLEALILPGQSVGDLRAIIAAVVCELEPRSFIDRMLARDYALQIVFGEFLRKAKKAVLEELASRAKARAGRTDEGDAQLIGQVFVDNLPTIDTLVTLEANVSRERDRIAALFDNRRTAALQAELAGEELRRGAGAALAYDGDDDAG